MKTRSLAGILAVGSLCGVLGSACDSQGSWGSRASRGSEGSQGAEGSRGSEGSRGESGAAPVVTPPAGRGLQPVVLPDFSTLEEPARGQMQARYSSLTAKVADRRATPAELASAYGDMGKLLMAATHLEASESCYLNAQALAPGDRRWPYYLGHLYKVKGPLEKSIASFQRALELQPDDVATLVWLGEVYLARGDAEAAEPLFAKALALQPDSAAARFGSGRSALAKKDFTRAVRDLNDALTRNPKATRIHYPLGMAYRGLGDVDRAQAHLAQQGEIEPRPTDPLMRELDDLLQTPEAYNVRGGRELDAGNWAAAAASFRKGLELAPGDPSLRHRLGTALSQMGDVRGAIEQFEQVARTSPTFARAHFSLGVLMNDSGRHQEAIDWFSTALKHEPGYVQARIQLAGVLARSGRPADALRHYEQALQEDPTRSDAAFGYAMALVRLGRYAEARERLTSALELHPNQPTFTHALARLLAAAPDDRVRDGRRAKMLVDALLKEEQSIELGETTAMMLAELGEYKQAAVLQGDVIAAARRAGLHDVVQRLTGNLKLYESGKPCRTPFTAQELP
jgi:tetratricopeptide (TPR) repeat protein